MSKQLKEQEMKEKVMELVNDQISSSPDIAELIVAGDPLEEMCEKIAKMVPNIAKHGTTAVGFTDYSFNDPMYGAWLSGLKSICRFKFKC